MQEQRPRGPMRFQTVRIHDRFFKEQSSIFGSFLRRWWWHLHGVEVQVSAIGAGGNAGRSATPHADAIGGAADLDDEHAQLGVVLVQMRVVDLAQASAASQNKTQLRPLARKREKQKLQSCQSKQSTSGLCAWMQPAPSPPFLAIFVISVRDLQASK